MHQKLQLPYPPNMSNVPKPMDNYITGELYGDFQQGSTCPGQPELFEITPVATCEYLTG